MDEIWKPILDFEGLYEVSNLGRVKSLVLTGQGHRNKRSERILRHGINSSGYPLVSLQNNKFKKSLAVHRLVATAFIENPTNKPCVNHIDGNKSNNMIDNLEWVSFSENNNHAWLNGLAKVTDKMRENGRLLGQNSGKPVGLYDEHGNLVTFYSSANEASRFLNIPAKHIRIICENIDIIPNPVFQYLIHNNQYNY